MYSVLLNCWRLARTLLSLVPRPYLADLWWRCTRRIHIIKDICFAREGASLRELAMQQAVVRGGSSQVDIRKYWLCFYTPLVSFLYIYIIIYIYIYMYIQYINTNE